MAGLRISAFEPASVFGLWFWAVLSPTPRLNTGPAGRYPALMKRMPWPLLLAVCLVVSQAFAAEPTVTIRTTEGAVEAQLPLTAVTSKARVKHRAPDGFGEPVAPTKAHLNREHYIEWQIGYDTPDKKAPFLAEGVVFQRRGETKYGYELSTLLLEARKLGLLTVEQFRSLRDELGTPRFTLEEDDQVALLEAPLPRAKLPAGFRRFAVASPLYVHETPHGRIEIHVKQKQRAVGSQAMLY